MLMIVIIDNNDNDNIDDNFNDDYNDNNVVIIMIVK